MMFGCFQSFKQRWELDAKVGVWQVLGYTAAGIASNAVVLMLIALIVGRFEAAYPAVYKALHNGISLTSAEFQLWFFHMANITVNAYLFTAISQCAQKKAQAAAFKISVLASLVVSSLPWLFFFGNILFMDHSGMPHLWTGTEVISFFLSSVNVLLAVYVPYRQLRRTISGALDGIRTA